MCRPLILLVDDDPAVRAAISFALEVEGFAVESFANSEAALALGPTRTAACAVLDHRLPGMDGLAMLARLRRLIRDIPAIIITSNASKQLRDQVATAGAMLVEKPLLCDAMVETIRSIIGDSSEVASEHDR